MFFFSFKCISNNFITAINVVVKTIIAKEILLVDIPQNTSILEAFNIHQLKK